MQTINKKDNPTAAPYVRLALAVIGQSGVDFQQGDIEAGRWLLHEGANLLEFANVAGAVDPGSLRTWVKAGCPGAELFRGKRSRGNDEQKGND